MNRGPRVGLVAAGFVVAVIFVGVASALIAEPGELPRWRIGLSEAIRFSPLAVAMSAGQLWGLRLYRAWVGLIIVVSYGMCAAPMAAWLSDRGVEYAIRMWLFLVPFHVGTFLLFRWLVRRMARARQQPTPWQPRA